MRGLALLTLILLPACLNERTPEQEVCAVLTASMEHDGVPVQGCVANYTGMSEWRAVVQVRPSGVLSERVVCAVDREAGRYHWTCR